MNNKIKKEISKKDKTLFIILCVCGILFSLITHLTLINNSVMYYLFGNITPIALFVFPVLCVILIFISCFFIFKKNNFSFIIPVAISLIGCLLAFTLADGSFSSKIQSDFLKNESEFKKIVEEHVSNETTEGTYEIEISKLNFVIPEKKLIISSVGNNKYAYFFVAIDIEERMEGYVYDPYGSPDEWLENGEYSEPLDIDKKWSYFVYHKGVNYD